MKLVEKILIYQADKSNYFINWKYIYRDVLFSFVYKKLNYICGSEDNFDAEYTDATNGDLWIAELEGFTKLEPSLRVKSFPVNQVMYEVSEFVTTAQHKQFASTSNLLKSVGPDLQKFIKTVTVTPVFKRSDACVAKYANQLRTGLIKYHNKNNSATEMYEKRFEKNRVRIVNNANKFIFLDDFMNIFKINPEFSSVIPTKNCKELFDSQIDADMLEALIKTNTILFVKFKHAMMLSANLYKKRNSSYTNKLYHFIREKVDDGKDKSYNAKFVKER